MANNLQSIKAPFGIVGDPARFLPVILLMFLPFWGKAQNFWVKSFLGGGFAPRHSLIESYSSEGVFISYRSKPQLLWMLALERQTKKGNLIEIGVNFRTKQTAHNYRYLRFSPSSDLESVDVVADGGFIPRGEAVVIVRDEGYRKVVRVVKEG